jgi:hypothetical protein
VTVWSESFSGAFGNGAPLNGDVWVDVTLARREWADAPADDDRLSFLLGIAQERCSAYLGDALASIQPIPDRYRLAVIYDARDLWSFEQSTAGLISIGDTAIRPPDLSRIVRANLRPHRGVKAR